MGGRGSSSGSVKKRRGGKNKGTTTREQGNPRGKELPLRPPQKPVRKEG
jgi:hypothetical protein